MKTSNRWNIRYIAGRFILGFVLTLMIGSINVEPAFSKDHNDRGHHDRYEQRERGHVRSEHRRYYRDRRGYERRGHRPYGYRERGYDYGPPGFIVAPPPPPGIGIFFPPILIQL